MSSSHPDPLEHLGPVPVPPALEAEVVRRGTALLGEGAPSPRARILDLALAGFCVVHCVWIARVVELLP